MKIKIWGVFLLLILLTACAPTKKIKNWVSNPSIQKGGNTDLDRLASDASDNHL